MPPGRYTRLVRLDAIGEAGHNRIASSHAVIVGCGALGTVVAELLARSGVGHLTLIDRDFVDLTNLHRQFLFDESDAAEGIPKAVAAERRLRAINSEIEITSVVDDLRPRRVADLLGRPDVIIDGTDNFEARFLLNDYAVEQGIPWIYGAAVGTYGIAMPVLPDRTACFRCVFDGPPEGLQPTCETAGVLGPVTALIGSLQAGVALQILSGNTDAVRDTITTVDLWHGPLREVSKPERDPDCPCCGHREFEWLNGKHDTPVSLCGRNAVQIHSERGVIDLAALKTRLELEGTVRSNDFALRFALAPHEITVFRDGRAIVHGTQDPAVARGLYAKWIGS
jgi:adenylyltransferase/sulfurtransferase